MEEKVKKVIIEEECCGEHDHHDEMKHQFKKEFKKEFKREFEHHKKHRPRPPFMIRKIVKQTKMFESKQDLVNFVNEVGEDGTEVDIFKIEDGLYKVVVFEKGVVRD